MKTVKIGALKNELSAYLRYVKQGEEVIVCDRDTPVARIVPIHASSVGEEATRRIPRKGIRPPIDPTPMDWDAFDALPAPTVSAEDAKAALDWVRGEY
jgi:prevent-host-death family protein